MNLREENILIGTSLSSTISDYLQLTKPGITISVLLSMLVGFLLGSGDAVNYVIMVHALIGTYLIAAGTAAHNQFIERNHDKLMKRTAKRPLPDHRISSKNGMVFSLTLIFTGLTYLALMVNTVAAFVSFTTTLIYLAAYTPMKRVSAINVVIGAVPGALPAVGGWAAATGNISHPGMWLLFGIVFLWQVPHVMAIAWMCKDDYANAGFCMVPKKDTKGFITAFWSIFCLVLLFPVTYALYYLDITGMVFLVLALILAGVFLFYGIKFLQSRTKQTAKELMFASIAYLPLVWLAVFIDTFFH